MSQINPSEHERLRLNTQSSRLFLGIQQGIDVLNALVDGDQPDGSTAILLRDVVLDDDTDLLRGMTVSVGIPQVADRRVSAVFLSYDSGTLTVQVGPNALTWTDGAHFTVYSSMKLWRLPPPTFVAQRTPPFAILGSMRAGFVGDPIKFVGEFAYSPVGRTLTDYHWKKYDADLVSGSLTAANTEDAPLVLSWATAGEKIIRYRVTDDAGEVGKTFRTVLQFPRSGEGAPYSEFIVKNFRWAGSGWRCDITVYGVADQNLFPRQAQIIIWAEDYFGFPVRGQAQGIGGQYRGAEEVVLTGWIRGDNALVSNEENSVTFSVESVERLMENITMPSYTFRDTNAIPALELTPDALEEDTDNYAPADFDGVGTLNISATVPVNITGLSGGTDGRRLRVVNVGAETITLKDEDAGSTAANQFNFAGDEILAPSDSIIIYYDGVALQWIVNDPAETSWYTFEDLTLDKAALHIIQQETTLPLLADVFTAMFAFRVSILDVPSAPLYSQLTQSILQACFGYCAGSRYGSITLARHRNMLTRDMRALLPIASIEFSKPDWLTLKPEGDAVVAIAQQFVEGRLGDDTPVIGKYPSTGPNGQGSIPTASGYLFLNQAQADEAAQVLFRQGNRNIRGLSLTTMNYRMLEPAFEEYATVILLAADNNEGYVWDNELNGETGREVVAQGMSIEFAQEGGFTVALDCAISVWGPHGREYDPADPAPTVQFLYGYGQALAAGPAYNALTDSDGNPLLDSDGNPLTDSDG